ncbi:hypothetical protein H4219_000727 [Mycoemilia scoparia]|uniref:Putative lipoate-protein ligase A n=1 Tax=Mycoemilia scoparia TaxID=417184 RepID=A0A9W8A2A7_9FUNG|nr:hypothetical protein H4219_000727 [Mycoemilia scoparia]
MKERDVWLARRSSGGGSVYHDMGNTNYSVFMPREAFSRELSAKMVAKALVQNDIPAYVNKRHDIAVDDFKVSGSAFKLTQKRAFHHGTMLIDVDLTRLKGCLHSGKDTLIANGVASVPSPVVNLRDYSWTIDHATFCNSVKLEFVKQFGTSQDIVEEVVWDETLIDVVDEIKQERDKLKTWDWLYGQTPEFTYTLSNTFDWGQVVGEK